MRVIVQLLNQKVLLLKVMPFSLVFSLELTQISQIICISRSFIIWWLFWVYLAKGQLIEALLLYLCQFIYLWTYLTSVLPTLFMLNPNQDQHVTPVFNHLNKNFISPVPIRKGTPFWEKKNIFLKDTLTLNFGIVYLLSCTNR